MITVILHGEDRQVDADSWSVDTNGYLSVTKNSEIAALFAPGWLAAALQDNLAGELGA